MISLFIGQQGTGKTWAMAHRVREHLVSRAKEARRDRAYPPVLIHDERVREGGGWRKDCIGCLAPPGARFETIDQYLAQLRSGRAPYIACIWGDDPAGLFEVAWRRRLVGGLGTVLVIDELDRVPMHVDKDDPVYRVCHHGRPYPIDVFGGCRRPESVNKAWISEASELHVFRIAEKNSLASLQASGSLSQQEISCLPTLGDHAYICVVR